MNSILSLLRAGLRRLTELCMVSLALLTLADVLGRYIFNVSVMGAVELTEILMVGVIFCGIVFATMAREHIVVDLVPVPGGDRGARVVHISSHLLAAGISALLAMVSWTQAESAAEYADQTTLLGLPLAPVVYFMSIMLFVNTLVELGQLGRSRNAKTAHLEQEAQND
ncbi:MAG: TRAP transporter small permease subunit [Alcaligenes faecalis]|uniref:TRAP transporter small permease protein n=2 Tax=Alcaligenes TaxID=507 RepID=A0ABY4NFS1_9BURK|nr:MULTISPECIES: TRAP transporter small permease [Alcaligenes]MCH4225334.1 TRAP transporter small permease subunit [Alcaligenes faecalis]UQN35814.1 TRAP transporter small permease subunit [Alcaligenes aquatilis]UYY87084.1 TRAP transporter small permease subunit [Alcaligenes sp. SMD-FA]